MASTELVKITLDLEEEQFLLAGHWYPWEMPIVNCQPAFSLNLDWQTARLNIQQCAANGLLQTESIRLEHVICGNVQPQTVLLINERDLRNYQVQFSSDLFSCWHSDRQWIELYFEIEL